MSKIKFSVLILILGIATVGLTTTIFSTSSTVNAQEENIPKWIQNVALYWGQGEISETEFVNALEFLGEEKILKLPTIESAEAQQITTALEEMEKRLEKIETSQTRQSISSQGIATNPSPPIESEDTRYPHTFAICPSDKIRHFDKIQFKLNLGKAIHSDKGNPSLSSQNNNIIILEEGHDEVGIPFQLEDRLADHLDNLGYSHSENNQNKKIHAFDLEIIDIEYAVICANKPGVSGSGNNLGYK